MSMTSAIFWNFKGVDSKKAIRRLKKTMNFNKVDLVEILEHYQYDQY